MEYTRDLGYCAATYLLEGGSGAMVTLVDGHFRPVPFSEMLDPATGRTRVRLVDIGSEHYRVARRYMVRLDREDFVEAAVLTDVARAAGMDAAAFQARFGYLVTSGV
jgi:6-phosphofructokinase 1